MLSKTLFKLTFASACFIAASQTRQAAAIDRVFDGSPTGMGTDYYTGPNWSAADTVPTAQFHQRAVIGTTAVDGLLNPAVTANTTPTTGGNRQAGGLILGREVGSSGSLNVVTGGTVNYAFTTQAATAGTNGAVYLGVFNSGPSTTQGGIGHLNISGDGTLTATGLFVEGETLGANRSSVSLSDSATVTLGPRLNVFTNTTNGIGADNLRFGRDLTITGPNVNFTNTGNMAFMSTSAYSANITSATAHSTLKTTGNVALGGTLAVNFSGLVSNPAVGQTWNLIDFGGNLTGSFSNAPIGSEVTVTGLPEPVELGASFQLRRTTGGTNGNLLQLVQQGLLVLRVNRDSGEMSITNPHGADIEIDGYRITSPLGSLLPSYKGISGAPAGQAGWEKPPTNSMTDLAELKPAPFSTLDFSSLPSLTLGTNAGKGFDPRAVADNVANFGTDGEDLQFFYTTPGGPVRGHVEYIGTKFENNLVLRVNPNSGQAFLKNDSQETLTFDGYTIRSTANSLDSLTWSGLGGTWAKTDLEPNALSETNLFGSITLAPNQQVAIGDIGAFTTDAAQAALSMEFILAESLSETGPLAGDHNADGAVNAADYVVWRKTNIGGPQGEIDFQQHFGEIGGGTVPEETFRIGSILFDDSAGSGGGSAVPEPAAAWLLVAALACVFACRTKRPRSPQPCYVTIKSSKTESGPVRVGGGTMWTRLNFSITAAMSLVAVLVSMQPAAAVPQGAILINYDFEDPGPPGEKAFAFDETGAPILGVIPGWTFTGPGTETFGHPERIGDSGTEGGGNPGNEMILSMNDGKAYQVATGFTIQSITSTQVYKFALDAHDIFTTNAMEQGIADSAQLTMRVFYGAWDPTQRTLMTQAINLTGDATRYEFTIPHNSPLLMNALGQTIGIEFTTTSSARNPLATKSWSGIDNVVLEIAPVLPGDFNGSGTITTADYDILRSNIAEDSCHAGIRGCPFAADGDLTGDYVVDLNDFRAFKNLFASGAGSGGSATNGNVPEPASATLLLAAGALMTCTRRRRSSPAPGANSRARAVLLAVISSVALSFPSTSEAELYVYDPFRLPTPLTNPANPALGQYNEWTPPPGGATEPYGPHVSLAGQNPTPPVGTRPNFFEGPWRTAGSAPAGVVHPSSISYINTPTEGGSARVAPIPNPTFAGTATSVCGADSGALYSSCDGRTARFFATPYDATANETVYISFIANFGTTDGDMGYRAVELFPASSAPTSDWSETRVGELGYNQFFGYGNPAQQNPATARLGLGLNGAQVIPADAPTYNDDGRNHLFVLKFVFSNQDAMDNLFLYMDPASTEEPEIAAAEFRNTNITLGAITTVTRYGGSVPSLATMGGLGYAGIFDELRIGTTFADVLPPGLPVPGDTDGDLDVDLDDYETIRDNFHRTNASGPGDGDVARSDGRLGFDGRVDMGDFFLWKREFEEAQSGSGSGSTTIPEPATAVFAFIAAFAFGRMRNRS